MRYTPLPFGASGPAGVSIAVPAGDADFGGNPPSDVGQQGITYYVNKNGNAVRDGTSEATAWQTIAEVNAFAFGPGDTVQFDGGKAYNDATLTLAASGNGTSGNEITVQSYGTGQAIISGTGRQYAIHINGKNFITINNLAATQTDGSTPNNTVIMLDGGDDCTLSNLTITGNHDATTAAGAGILVQNACLRFDIDACTITDVNWHCIFVKGGQGTSLNSTIQNCTLGTHGQQASGNGDMIQLNDDIGNNITIDSNTFDNQNSANGENGIDIKGGTGQVISNNVFVQTRQSAILIQEGTGAGTPTSVTVNDNDITGEIQNGGRAIGVDDNATAVFNRNKIVCNGTTQDLVRISVGASAGNAPTAFFNANAFEIPAGEGATQVMVVKRGATVTLNNNSLLSRNGNTTTEMLFADNTVTGVIRVRNTIFDSNGPATLLLHSDVADPFLPSNNLYFGQAANWANINGTPYTEATLISTYDTSGSTTGDPDFASQDENNANYLLPNAGSPALNLGSNAFNPATDLVGTSYDDPPNAGCREGNA